MFVIENTVIIEAKISDEHMKQHYFMMVKEQLGAWNSEIFSVIPPSIICRETIITYYFDGQ